MINLFLFVDNFHGPLGVFCTRVGPRDVGGSRNQHCLVRVPNVGSKAELDLSLLGHSPNVAEVPPLWQTRDVNMIVNDPRILTLTGLVQDWSIIRT